MVLNCKGMHVIDNLNRHKLFAVCTEQVRSPYTELAVSGLPNPTLIGGGGTICPGLRPAGGYHT